MNARRRAGADEAAARGHAALERGDLDTARRELEAAVGRYASLGIGDAHAVAALGNLGRAYTLLGDPARAADLLRRVVEGKRRNREDAASLHIGLTNLALALQAAGDSDAADAALDEAARLPGLSAERRERIEQEQAFHRMHRGDFAGALVMLSRSLRAIDARERRGLLPTPSRERGTVLNNMGACYSELQNWAEARRHWEEAVRVRRICAPGTIELANSHGNLAGLPHQPSAELVEEAVRLGARVAPASAAVAVARAHRAGALLEAGDLDGALRVASEAIDAAPAANRNLAELHLVAATAQLRLGDARAAEAMALRAYRICSKISTDLRELRPILGVLGHLARGRGDLATAAARYDEAIGLAERYRLGSAREPGLERWFGGAREIYHGRIEVAARRTGDGEAAFAAAEAFRARTLAELLAAGTRAPVADDAIQERLAAIYSELDGLGDPPPPLQAGGVARWSAPAEEDQRAAPAEEERRAAPADEERRAALEAERDELEARAERERLGRLAEEPVAAQREYPVPCTVAEVRRMLGDGVTVVVFEVTDDEAFRWTVTADAFDFRRLAAGAGEVRAAVAEVLDSCRKSGGRAQPVAALRRLGAWLLADLPPGERLIVCADATLAYLPFEALTERVVSYAPSATTLVRFGDRRRAEPWREFAGFAVADAPGQPRIPEATGEIEAAAARLGGVTVCRSGAEASVEAIREYARGSRYVHFAVHALARDDEPLYSALALTAGHLHAYEMFSLDLCADVVTLSACSSAVGADRSGEGVVGLSRALFAAGARAVLLTRWPVHDRPVRALIEAFYQALSEGRRPSEALHEAVRTVRERRPALFAHPREYAPFMLLETGV